MAEKESFETSLQQLEGVVERLEGGELPLEEALRAFEQGVQAAARCRETLKGVEMRVEALLKDQSGSLDVEDFEQE